MIISPLEQFNILSVYDFSLAGVASFETVYAKLLFLTWSILYNLPVGVLNSAYTFLSNDLPLFWMAVNTLSAFATTMVQETFLGAPLIYALSTWICDLLIATNLIQLYTAIDSAYNVYHSTVALLWHTLYTDLNILYSADHLFFSKFFDLFSGSQQTHSASGNGLAKTNIFVGTNLSFISGVPSIGFGIANFYFFFMEIGWSTWTLIYQAIVEKLLYLSTKDLSYLILSLNTSTIWLTIGFLFLTFLFTTTLISVGTTLVSKNRWQTLFELFYDLILNVLNENAGPKGKKFFPLIFTTFMIILICNLQGMIPYSFTVTSHLIVTFSMALAIFIGINILGILKNRRHFLSLFFPPGTPLVLAPLLVFIELVSYVFRVLSLSIRLFANLMSGHTLLKILSAYAWLAVSAWGLYLIPLVIILLVTGLELAIGFLQAYIFSVLLCIYINDAFNLH